MKKDVSVFLAHILGEIRKIEISLYGISKKDFLADSDKKDATLRRLEVIGEAVKNIPSEFRKGNPAVPWDDIAGTRDVLIHHYFGVDCDEVWRIIQKDLPELKKKIKKIQEN